MLPLGVASNPLTVPIELGIVWRQQDKACQRPLGEGIYKSRVAVASLDHPMGRHRSLIHDPHMALRWLLCLRLSHWLPRIRGRYCAFPTGLPGERSACSWRMPAL